MLKMEYLDVIILLWVQVEFVRSAYISHYWPFPVSFKIKPPGFVLPNLGHLPASCQHRCSRRRRKSIPEPSGRYEQTV